MYKISLIFISFLIFPIFINGESLQLSKNMGYENNYQKALYRAKKENKPLMLVVEERFCPWCKKLTQKTLLHTKISQIIKENFIGVKLFQDENYIPNQFYADVFPTVFFINPYNEDYYFKSRGYKGAVKFKKRLLHAIRSHKHRDDE